MRVLVVDVGGSSIKLKLWQGRQSSSFPSGRHLSAEEATRCILTLTATWKYDAVSMGFPGLILHGKIKESTANLGNGWGGFDFKKHFRRPVKIINDGAMQALGSYSGGRMLFLGLGTGLGSALILDDVVIPLALGDLAHSRNRSLGETLGKQGLVRLGRKRWEEQVHRAVRSLRDAFRTDYVVLGGGNVKRLQRLPSGARRGDNDNAFIGGARLWGLAGAHARPGKKHIWVIT
jgi:predicted NBD/HSP70 family sugar kinase